ncbi:MAG: hypothetical protein HY360_05210 [Verrucomicrobia bacterium]|nr:hypothetical protein [Verrucomicrobiota bacterium]
MRQNPLITKGIRAALAAWGLGLLGIASIPLQAGESEELVRVQINPRSHDVSHEFNTDHSYVAGAKAHLGDADFGHISEYANHVRYVISPQINKGTLLRAGINWQRFSFGVPARAPVPNTLQSASAVLGADIELTDQWLMRVETEPGVYSDFQDIGFEDVNSPTILGFSYLVDENLQWFFGLSADPRRDIPVLPGAGVRWKFADQWTLMFLVPKPRIEYAVNEAVTFYLGGEIKAGTFKVARNFGDPFGRPRLNNASLDYTEFRAGLGASLKIVPGLTLDMEGGYLLSREFNYQDADDRVESNEGAPYGQVAVRMGF